MEGEFVSYTETFIFLNFTGRVCYGAVDTHKQNPVT